MSVARNLAFLDLVELARALERNDISPVELLSACLERIALTNPGLNALVTLDEAGAATTARESELRQRAGKRLGPLDGIPLSIKDNLFVRGLRATWGSRLYEQFVPDQDDLWVTRLRHAGAVIIGKSNTPEFALATHTDNPLFGPTRNPWSRDHVPGGSSGGAAACVAAGMLPLAVGTDAGGSIRLPAGFTGVVGLKPSVGRIPRLYGFPPIVTDFQVIGLLARSVDSVELALRVLAGPDDRDRASLAFQREPESTSPDPVRLGVVEVVGAEPVDPEVLQALRHAANRAAQHGLTVEQIPAPYDLDVLKRFWAVLSSAGLARVLARFSEGQQEHVTPPMLALARQGASLTGIQYADALDQLGTFRAAVAAAFGAHDALLTPTSPVQPWRIGEGPPALVEGRKLDARTPLAFSTFANATGYPAISLPWCLSRAGLPIGVQLVARFGQERRLISIAKELERLSPWNAARPPEIWSPS